MTDVAMQLFNNIANKCFCLPLWLVRLEVEAAKFSEIAATNWHGTVSKGTWIMNNACVKTLFHTVVMICCFLQCIFIADKITDGFTADENSIRCHHMLRRNFSPNQFIICGEWWVWWILCTGLASWYNIYRVFRPIARTPNFSAFLLKYR
jgi:hypothetical protein